MVSSKAVIAPLSATPWEKASNSAVPSLMMAPMSVPSGMVMVVVKPVVVAMPLATSSGVNPRYSTWVVKKW